MTISTSCPQVRSLRTTIERHILDLYEADGTTLKAQANWPGYYTMPNGTRIPAVYVVGEAMVPSDWVVTGIECTITDVPAPARAPACRQRCWTSAAVWHAPSPGTVLRTPPGPRPHTRP
jgi:hypothetical protein